MYAEWSHGTKLRFVHPYAGFPSDQSWARRYLIVGSVYTVDYIVLGALHTRIYFEEVEGKGFNSEQFEAV